MAYTVGEMARRLGVPASTIRYYDKEGLLPFVGRSSGGIRVFTEKDFEWLRIIECLKKTGMSLKDIREYIELAMQGDETIARRLELFRKQRTVLETRMAELQQTMDTLDYKCWFYETAAARGSTEGISDLPDEALPEALRPVCVPPRRRRQKKYDPKTPPPQKGAALFCATGVPTITTHPAKILPSPLYLVLQRTIWHQTKRKIAKNPAAKC